jgi:hypothetical protein
MANDPIRIELRGLASEVADAQRDLQATLDALEERLLPARAAQRLVREHDPALVLGAVVAAGLAVGLIRDNSPTVRAAALVAAAALGAITCHLTGADRNGR